MIYLNGEKITPTIFPDQTSQVWKLPEGAIKKYNIVTWDFDSESEFMHLAQLKVLIDHSGGEAFLDIPYLPYARQDKDVLNDKTFALHAFAKLINALKFNSVYSLDAHSDVASEEIKKFRSNDPEEFIMKSIEACQPSVIVFPDAGANARYGGLLYNKKLKIITADKVRDQQTGKILALRLLNDHPGQLRGLKFLIVDDICDGGATFELVAMRLRETFGGNIFLYTTHGIYSRGLRGMKSAGISRFFSKEGEHFQSRVTANDVHVQPWGKENVQSTDARV